MNRAAAEWLTSAPTGFAWLEVMTDETNRPFDLLFLEVNPAFAELTGQDAGRLIGSVLSEAAAGLPKGLLELQQCLKTAETGAVLDLERHCADVGRWFRLRLSSPQSGYVGVHLQDISVEQQLASALNTAMEALGAQEQQLAEALRNSRGNYQLITELASDIIWVYNVTRGRFDYISPAVESILGYTQEEAFALSLEELLPEPFFSDWSRISQEREQAFTQGHFKKDASYLLEMQNIAKNGQLVWVESSSKYYYNDHQEIEIIGVSRKIEERKKAEERVLYLSYHDELTGLYNRRFYEEEARRLDTSRNLPLTLVLADVNGLKLTNDVFGHKLGDQMLVRVAGILQRTCRSDDIIARLGGDEFILLLPHTDRSAAEALIRRLREELSEDASSFVPLSVSFGCSTKKQAEQLLEGVFVEAENRMYRQKLLESDSLRSNAIRQLTDALYRKSYLEEEHSRQVSELCRKMTRALELGEESETDLTVLGFLHDIGKITLDECVLLKAAGLSLEEWKDVRRHPEIGYQILRSSKEFMHLAEAVLYHHERVDGRGYPRGLKGDDIPLLSRIVAIVDAFDAMTSYRTYRSTKSVGEAVQELRKQAGQQFDAELVEVFIEQVVCKSAQRGGGDMEA
jgi:diguanylate cyclase (GGDEF)-like protein/PAS domain S-box-containing protein